MPSARAVAGDSRFVGDVVLVGAVAVDPVGVLTRTAAVAAEASTTHAASAIAVVERHEGRGASRGTDLIPGSNGAGGGRLSP